MPLELPTYSDASSSYWPKGWDFERFSHATQDDRDSLPEGELEKMQAGLREVLGERGIGKLAMYLYRQEQEREAKTTANEAEAAAAPATDGSDTTTTTATATATANEDEDAQSTPLPPNWLKQWTESHQDNPWGFTAFRTACYDDETRWTDFKANLQKLIEEPFDRDAKDTALLSKKVELARHKFEIRWIEDPGLVGATVEDLRTRFAAIKGDNPSGILPNLFLCASPAAVDSVSSTPLDEKDTLATESKRGRSTTPYLLAVTADANPGLEEGHEERAAFKPVFKVAAEALIDQLWWQVDADMMPLRELTRWVQASDELGGTGATDSGELEEVWSSSAPPIGNVRKRMRLRELS